MWHTEVHTQADHVIMQTKGGEGDAVKYSSHFQGKYVVLTAYQGQVRVKGTIAQDFLNLFFLQISFHCATCFKTKTILTVISYSQR